jgi:hypothetical protein
MNADSIAIFWSNEVNLGIIQVVESDSLVCTGDTAEIQVSINLPTQIHRKTLKEPFLKVYPNPARINFTAENNSTHETTWQLYNSIGTKLLNSTLEANQKTSYNCAHLPSGIYLIYSEIGDSLFIEKLVIE